MKIISTIHKLLFFKTTDPSYIPWTQRYEKNILSSYESEKLSDYADN